MSDRYPTPQFRRTALAPGILGAIVLLAGVALLETDGFIFIRFVVSILALILCVYAVQARQWWWIIGLVPITLLWNPVVEFSIDRVLFLGAHYIAVLIFIATGIFVKIRNLDDRNQRPNKRS